MEWFKDIFTLKCPKCNSEMEFSYDPTIDKNIYECTECGKEWI